MGGGYFQIYRSLFSSTLWTNESHEAIALWIWMCGNKDSRGYVAASIPGMAHACRVSIEQVEDALKRWTEPDKFSRSKSNEGRRIQEVDGGWIILNHKKYDIRSGETEGQLAAELDKKRAADAARKREARASARTAQVGAKRPKTITPCPADASRANPASHMELESVQSVRGVFISTPTPTQSSDVRERRPKTDPDPDRINPSQTATKQPQDTGLKSAINQAVNAIWSDWPRNPAAKESKVTATDAALHLLGDPTDLERFKVLSFEYVNRHFGDKPVKLETFMQQLTAGDPKVKGLCPDGFDWDNPTAYVPQDLPKSPPNTCLIADIMSDD